MTSVREVGHFEVRSRPDRDRVIVAVSGELDIATVGAVQAALDELYAVGWMSVVFDLRELSFIDSMGLSLLLEAERTAQRSGAAFAIVDGSPAVARLLEVVGLEEYFRCARVR
jgi:anti-anti-sigma factor